MGTGRWDRFGAGGKKWLVASGEKESVPGDCVGGKTRRSKRDPSLRSG
jgi:hypothetical protein